MQNSLRIHTRVRNGGGLCGIKLHFLDPSAPLILAAGKDFTENIHRVPFGSYFPLRADGSHGQTSWDIVPMFVGFCVADQGYHRMNPMSSRELTLPKTKFSSSSQLPGDEL